VKFLQPSHEFTFGVGMTFISYPLVLTPLYNKFVRACRFWSLVFMQDFSVESKTSGICSSSTRFYKENRMHLVYAAGSIYTHMIDNRV
jgi:hypothetical protein